jgi:hypothetical protein
MFKFVFFSLFLLIGTIRTRAVLDRETTPHYWLTVVAQDHGIVTLSASIEVSSSPQVSYMYILHPRTLFKERKKLNKTLWACLAGQ